MSLFLALSCAAIVLNVLVLSKVIRLDRFGGRASSGLGKGYVAPTNLPDHPYSAGPLAR